MSWLSRLFGVTPSTSDGRPDLAGPPQIGSRPTIPAVDFMVVDVETACSRASSICQIGIVGFRDGREVLAFESLIDPRDDFDDGNVRIHGIKERHVRGKPHFGELHGTLCDHLSGNVTVSHSNFDKGAIAAACRVHGKPELEARWLDSLAVARHSWPDLPSHRLGALASHLGIAHRHHDALSDARTAGLVIVRAIETTGISLPNWFGTLSSQSGGRRAPSASIKRSGATEGPLAGHCIALTGDFSVPRAELADQISAAGGTVTTGPTRKTTIFVMGIPDPSSFAGKAKSSKQIKAEELASDGQAIEFLDEAALRLRMVP